MALSEPDLLEVEDLSMRPLVSIPEDVEPESDTSDTDDITTEFDPKYRQPLIGLLYLGHLDHTVSRYGHTFDLSTPSQRERLAAGVIHKEYINSVAAEAAWASLIVALYLDKVDNDPLPEAIGPDAKTNVRDHFNWVVDNLKPALINELFEECLILDAKVGGALAELREVSKA